VKITKAKKPVKTSSKKKSLAKPVTKRKSA
jgi:hypothetical protein